MLSVLIATYNVNTFSLVEKLCQQLEETKITFEIICIDDASKSSLNIQNQQINLLSNCSFETLPKNIGRSKLRNLLVRRSNYNWLLFLDGDVLPTSTDFINNYIGETEKNISSVFLGGIAYKNNENQSQLRWKLGKKGEEKIAEIRNTKPYNYFFTANFLIRKKILQSIKFNEALTKYGYEDLLFAKELENKKIAVKHIDNPVFHLGIDENQIFIDKTKQALENLMLLINTSKLKKEDTKISKTFFKLKRMGVVHILNLFSGRFEWLAEKKSSVFFYQLFRLTYLHKVFKNSK